jgi:hypothetical protein
VESVAARKKKSQIYAAAGAFFTPALQADRKREYGAWRGLLIKIKRPILQITAGRYLELSRMCEVGCAKNVFAPAEGVGGWVAASLATCECNKQRGGAQGVIS